jgi:uncharacterized protein (TIGR03437 family)
MVPYGISGQDSVEIQFYGVFELALFNPPISNSSQLASWIPWETSSATLSQPLSVSVAAAAPGVFAGGNGAGQAIAINADGLLNSIADEATKGSTVTFYVTGTGIENRSVIDGQTAEAPLWSPAQSVVVQFGGVAASTVTATAVPGLIAGLTKVTATIPAGAPSGTAVPVSITVGGVAAQSGVTIAIQ